MKTIRHIPDTNLSIHILHIFEGSEIIDIVVGHAHTTKAGRNVTAEENAWALTKALGYKQ